MFFFFDNVSNICGSRSQWIYNFSFNVWQKYDICCFLHLPGNIESSDSSLPLFTTVGLICKPQWRVPFFRMEFSSIFTRFHPLRSTVEDWIKRWELLRRWWSNYWWFDKYFAFSFTIFGYPFDTSNTIEIVFYGFVWRLVELLFYCVIGIFVYSELYSARRFLDIESTSLKKNFVNTSLYKEKQN